MTCKPQTKEQRLFNLMKRRWVSPALAARELHCYSLAQRVSEWKAAGIKVLDQWVKSGNTRFKQYRIP